MRISAVIPVFGRKESFQYAIFSAASELSTKDEIIVVDDGSSPPVDLADIGPLNCDLRLVRKPNGGPASARNRGVAEARGQLIAFLDSDDEWLPGKIVAQMEAMVRHGSDLVAVTCGWRETVNGEGYRVRMPVPPLSKSDFFAGCWFCPGSTLLLTREAFQRIGPLREDIRRLEDLEWFLRFGQAGGRLIVADVIGASIARGDNARPAFVEQAAQAIIRDLNMIALPTADERRDLLAYIDLERARAFRNVGDYARLALHMARSLWRRPRLQPALKKWWT